jgi:hypothetical protein
VRIADVLFKPLFDLADTGPTATYVPRAVHVCNWVDGLFLLF